MSIQRIHQVKHGPFHEHSSQLHSIAVGVPNWNKVNTGLFKMYEVLYLLMLLHNETLMQRNDLQAEVLGKRVVVQHIPLGGLLEWDVNKSSASAMSSFNSHEKGGIHAPLGSSTPLVSRYGDDNPSSLTYIPSSSARASSAGFGGSSFMTQPARNTPARAIPKYQNSMGPPT